ncbi:MAG TPA: LysE family transporter [Thermoplasmata archaeon]|nr:LysE family transporter [Thermoplasmata archaeon]
MNVAESAAFGIALGFSLTIPPGPMNALIASMAVRSARAGTVTGLGAMCADAVLGAVVFAFSASVDLSALVRPIDAVGAVALAYFGVRTLRAPRAVNAPASTTVRTFSQAFVLGVGNPFQILWWLTVGLAFARLGGAVLLAGLFGAIAVWVVAFPLAVHAGVRRFPGAYRAIVLISGALLLGFAAYFAALAVY